MKHSVAHDLDPKLAKKATEQALVHYQQKYPQASLSLAWLDETRAQLKVGVKGMEIKGSIAIGASAIDMDFSIPLLLRAFQGRAVAVIEREIQVWMQKAKDGQLA